MSSLFVSVYISFPHDCALVDNSFYLHGRAMDSFLKIETKIFEILSPLTKFAKNVCFSVVNTLKIPCPKRRGDWSFRESQVKTAWIILWNNKGERKCWMPCLRLVYGNNSLKFTALWIAHKYWALVVKKLYFIDWMKIKDLSLLLFIMWKEMRGTMPIRPMFDRREINPLCLED